MLFRTDEEVLYVGIVGIDFIIVTNIVNAYKENGPRGKKEMFEIPLYCVDELNVEVEAFSHIEKGNKRNIKSKNNKVYMKYF